MATTAQEQGNGGLYNAGLLNIYFYYLFHSLTRNSVKDSKFESVDYDCIEYHFLISCVQYE